MENKDKKIYIRIIEVIAILLIAIGILMIIFPKITNFLYEEDVKYIKKNFIVQTISNEEENYDELYEELKRRNEVLYKEKQKNLKDPFSYEQSNINLESYGLEENIIGFISIPKINIELPILLGANTENMLKGAVHLTETSYPIGGENTNSVIAAHRGWSWSKMFRNIDKLEIGDEIYIQNFKEKLTYTVYDIKIVNPDNISELEIEEGKDLITLITCHPYRVNTQRYIVKANRST